MRNEPVLNIYHIGIAENVLGFGKRLVFWLAGCPFSCYNCIEEKLKDPSIGRSIPVSEVYKMTENVINNIEGVTFSGGEPLLLSNELLSFLELLPSGIDKMLFTGYSPEELNNDQTKCFKKFDLAVTGRFENEKRGNFLWRGSSNKKFYSPSGKYSDQYLDDLYLKESAGLEITVTDGKLLFYGIPTEKDEIEAVRERLINGEGIKIG